MNLISKILLYAGIAFCILSLLTGRLARWRSDIDVRQVLGDRTVFISLHEIGDFLLLLYLLSLAIMALARYLDLRMWR